MNKVDIVRAWKDAEYRASLSPADRALVPENPAGLVELSEDELEGIAGGGDSYGATACCVYVTRA